MRLGFGGMAAVAFAIMCAVGAVTMSLRGADERADKAEALVVTIDAARRGEKQRADVGAVVAREADAATTTQTRVERQTVTVINTVEASPHAATPIPAELARAWVAGLGRMCDDAPGACAASGGANRADGAAGDEPVPEGAPSGGGRFDPR